MMPDEKDYPNLYPGDHWHVKGHQDDSGFHVTESYVEQSMTDEEFTIEVRRHIIAILKAFMRRFGVDLLHIK
jgi:hypothetical protein